MIKEASTLPIKMQAMSSLIYQSVWFSISQLSQFTTSQRSAFSPCHYCRLVIAVKSLLKCCIKWNSWLVRNNSITARVLLSAAVQCQQSVWFEHCREGKDREREHECKFTLRMCKRSKGRSVQTCR